MDWEWENIFIVSGQTPLHVLQEKHKQIIIPDAQLIHFPAVDLSVTKFIELPLPAQSTEIITTAAKIWFSKRKKVAEAIDGELDED